MNDPITDLMKFFATELGIPPATVAFVIPMMMILCARVTRLIPDTATGWLHYVRIVCKILSLYVKDNTGVPATLAVDGSVIRKTPIDTTPEPIKVDANLLPTPNLFTGVTHNEG